MMSQYLHVLGSLWLIKQVFFFLTRQILIYNDGLPKGKRPPAGMGAGI